MNTSESVGSVSLLLVGVIYFVVRIVGKYAGAFLGCLDQQLYLALRFFRPVPGGLLNGNQVFQLNYLGLALIPQAGVAIGLAAMGARTLGGETGRGLETTPPHNKDYYAWTVPSGSPGSVRSAALPKMKGFSNSSIISARLSCCCFLCVRG